MKERHKIRNPQSGIWKKILIIAFWLAVWQIVHWIVDNPIFFAGPLEVLEELAHMAGSRDFMMSVGNSLLRITGGFCAAFLSACLLSAAAYRSRLLEEVLGPFVALVKSVPVASVVVLLLIWFGAEYLSVYITFMVVFPNIYLNVLGGLKQTDKELLEMAEVFRFSFLQKLLYLYRPAVMPYLLAGTAVSVGMSFKSGVAAEVIGLPSSSIGEGLYNAKIYLNTAGVFAWTLVIILLSSLMERLLLWLLAQLGHQGRATVVRKPRVKETERRAVGGEALVLEDITVAFGEKRALEHIDARFDADGVYCIMGPSGCGKTTLLRVCAGLQETAAGRAVRRQRTAMAFQEERLCLRLSALNNVLLAADRQYSVKEVISCVGEIFPADALRQPAEQLSGGMKRRIAVARAVLSDADCLLLDEPFAGLDEANHERLLRWILKNRNGRLLVVTTHEESDAGRMGAKTLRLGRRLDSF